MKQTVAIIMVLCCISVFQLNAINERACATSCMSSSSSDCCSGCAPTPIYQTDFTFRSSEEIKARQTGFLLLTAPGIYCLAEDVTGSILVQGNSITIDLNGHILSGFGGNDGVSVTNPGEGVLTDVRIINGFLNGSTVAGAGNGITIDGTGVTQLPARPGFSGTVESIVLQDLVITGWKNGIAAFSTDGIAINRVTTESNFNDGMQLGDFGLPCINVTVSDCLSELNGNFDTPPSNGSNGIEIIDTSVVRIERTQLTHNAANGLFVTSNFGLDIQLVQNVACANCTAYSNIGNGFMTQTAQTIQFNNCIADTNNVNGFYAANGSFNIEYSNCTAINNGGGGGGEGQGFFADASSIIVYDACHALSSLHNGFQVIDSLNISLLNCVSGSNSGNGFELISSNAPASTSRDIIVKNCVAAGNHCNGFHGLNVRGGLLIESCIAEGNNGGSTSLIDFPAGFFLEGSDNISIVRSCTAQNNHVGFAQDVAANNFFCSNVACNNTVYNYDPTITNAPVTSPANAYGVQNVDCSNTDPDLIAAIAACTTPCP